MGKFVFGIRDRLVITVCLAVLVDVRGDDLRAVPTGASARRGYVRRANRRSIQSRARCDRDAGTRRPGRDARRHCFRETVRKRRPHGAVADGFRRGGRLAGTYRGRHAGQTGDDAARRDSRTRRRPQARRRRRATAICSSSPRPSVPALRKSARGRLGSRSARSTPFRRTPSNTPRPPLSRACSSCF